MSCRAYRLSDEMRCMCGMTWSVNDPNPPLCAEEARRQHRAIPTSSKPKTPERTEHALMTSMAQEYERAMMEHRAMPYAARQVKAMRSAVKLFKP